MPQTKFQDVIFTLMMVVLMVYAMVCYNITLSRGALTPDIFFLAFGELPLMGAAAFCLEFFVVGHLSKFLAFRIADPSRVRPGMVVFAISAVTVCLMCPSMSLIAVLAIQHGSGDGFLLRWLHTAAWNFPMAFLWQMLFAGPIVRKVFRMMFRKQLIQK